MDAYKVLDLPRNATKDEIRAAYKKMALKWHPDRNMADKENANQKFIEILHAYKALTTRRRRRRVPQNTRFENEAMRSGAPPSPTSDHFYTTSSVPNCSPASEQCPHKGSSYYSTLDPSSVPSSPQFAAPRMSHSKYQNNTHARPAPSTNASTPSINESTINSCSSSTTSTSSESYNSSSSDTMPPVSPKINNTSTIPTGRRKTQSPNFQNPPRAKLRKRSKPRQEQKSTSNRRKSGSAAAYDIPPKTSSDEFVFVPSLGKDERDEKVAEFSIEFTLEELFHGAHHRYRLKRHFLSGKRKNIVFDVDIPPGCRPGSKVVFHNVGNERKDGTLQDVIFVVEEAPHERFRRMKDNLVFDIKFPWVKPLQDEKTKVFFEGLDGELLKLEIDYPTDGPMTGSHIIPGAGMPVRRNGDVIGRGDLIVRWEVVVSSASKWGALKKALHINT